MNINKQLLSLLRAEFAILFIIHLLISSCSKDSEIEIQNMNTGEFKFESMNYSTPYALYEVNEDSNSYLYLYSEGLSLSGDNPVSFYGMGDLILISLGESIYNSTNHSIQNLKTDEYIECNEGSVFISLQTQDANPTGYEISSGTLMNKVVKGYYQFEYNLMLKNGETVEGSYLGGLIVL